ncbi:MAG: hypothetical protein [Cotesia congregata filamentous virus 2]
MSGAQKSNVTVLYIDYHEIKNSNYDIIQLFKNRYFSQIVNNKIGGGLHNNTNNILIWRGEHNIQQELNFRQEGKHNNHIITHNLLIYQRLLVVDPSFEQLKYLHCSKKCTFFGFTNLNNLIFIKCLVFLYNAGVILTFDTLLLDEYVNLDISIINNAFSNQNDYTHTQFQQINNLQLKQTISYDASRLDVVAFFQNLNVFFYKYKDTLSARTLRWTIESKIDDLQRYHFILFQENECLNLFFRNYISDRYFTRIYHTIDSSHMPPKPFLSANKLNNALMLYYSKLNIILNPYSFTAYNYFQNQYSQCMNIFLLDELQYSFFVCDTFTLHNKINIAHKLNYLTSSLTFYESFFV